MRVRTGKIIKSISIFGNMTSGFQPTTSGDAVYFGYQGFALNNSSFDKRFSIISGHKYFFYADAILDPNRTTNGSARFYDTVEHTTKSNSDGFASNDITYRIIEATASSSNCTINWFRAAAYSGVGWNTNDKINYGILIDLTDLGLDALTAQQFYNKYNKYFSLLASGEEIVIDRGSGKANYLVESSSINMSGITGYEMKCGNNAYGHQFTPSKWGTAAGYVINRATGGYNGMPMSEWHKTAGTAGGFYTWLNRGFTLTEGHTYTASVYVYSNKTATTNGYICSVNSSALSNYYIVGSSFNLKQGWQRLTYTFTVASGKTSTDYCYSPIIYANPDAGEWVIKLSGFQIEENDHATAFTTGKDFNVSCNITEKMYGYNQKIQPTVNTSHNGNAISYDIATNTFTLTANSATGTRTYFGLSCTNLSSLQSHKTLCIATVTEVSITNNFSNITFTWALSNITDSRTTKTPGLIYGIGTWGATTTANYLNIRTNSSNLFVEGDYFKVKDVQIIDLTDWFGAGKEPATVAEFKEKFSKDYYGYCPNKIMLTQGMINALPVYEYNQLASINRDVSNGLTALFNSLTNRVNISGKSIANSTYLKLCNYFNSTIDHKYYVSVTGNNVGNGSAFLPTLHPTNLINNPKIITANTTMTNAIIRFNLPNEESINTDVIVQIIDLTDWYGTGNEPGTVAEFKATFPHKYYPYIKKSQLNRYQINSLGRD